MNMLAFIQSADHHEMQQSGVHGHSEEQKENSFFTFFQQGGTMIIRSATTADTARLLEIYSWYVENTAVTYEYESPSMDEFGRRISNTLERYPYFVLENDNIIQGYAYAGSFHSRAAYSRCCELSIYLDHNAKGHGYGRKLYEALEEKLREMGFLNLYACIADPMTEDEYLTRNSEQFHTHMGFTKIGTFHRCGWKFGRWYNMIYMEKIIEAEGYKGDRV